MSVWLQNRFPTPGLQSKMRSIQSILGASNRHRETTLIHPLTKHLSAADSLQGSGIGELIGCGFHPHGAHFRDRFANWLCQ